MAQRYVVTCKDLGHESIHDGRVFSATDYDDAAIQWARDEDHRSADYWIVGGQHAHVTVTPIDGEFNPVGEDKDMIVYGESVPVYTARLVVGA